MELLMIRHGEASSMPMDESGPPLSESGIRAMKKMANLLESQPVQPERLFSSPLKRARQTAEIVNELWDLRLETVDWLKPGVEPSRILSELRKIREGQLALVGHLPTLGWLLSTLLWGLPPKEISVPKGSVTCLKVEEWEPSGAKLKWILGPDLDF